MLLQYCREKMMNKDLEEEDLSGFDGDFKAKLSSYLDFEKKGLRRKDGRRSYTKDNRGYNQMEDYLWRRRQDAAGRR